MGTEKGPVLAAIDVGTNSIHMVVVQVHLDPPHFIVLTRAKEMVRLGETCRQTGWLTPVAMERGLTALKRFKELAQSYSAQMIAVATSAVREATNGPEFLQQIERLVGLKVDLISGREEARRIYLGVLSALSFEGLPHVIVDIGGGSTEFILGDGGEPSFLGSVKVGAVRLTQEYIHSDPINASDFEKLQQHIRLRLEPVIADLRQAGRYERLVGTSGTIESLAQLDAAADSRRPYTLTRERLQGLVQQLQGMSIAQRRKLPNIPERRADVILAGSMVLLETMKLLDAPHLTVCEQSLREGLVVDWMVKQGLIASYAGYQAAIRERSVYALAQQYRADDLHSQQVARFALDLFDQTRMLGLHTWDQDSRYLLWAAAILHNIGHYVSHSAHHKHSYYLIRNGNLLGHTETEIELIAQLARYHRNSPPKRRHETWAALPKDQRLLVSQLSCLLRLATTLDRRRQQSVAAIQLDQEPNRALNLQLQPVDPSDDCTLELWNLTDEKQVFEAEFNVSLSVTCAVARVPSRA
ncbi:Ppx/GppA phosphatase family protein [Candidatus Cyanaurora vandensis]|uniref:Ppx/GppA phosphatase family protein n=1 Tax=Candidatus Cyanaurora vandensis TaxID=2714958 RepID=UPI00257A4E9A|nr:Ppx/GppA phosphatase family protein [Candidatus Cyanaurora vandensis]